MTFSIFRKLLWLYYLCKSSLVIQTVMPSIVTLAGKLIRINFDSNRIELSTNRGRTWVNRFGGTFCGKFVELVAFGDEIFALTDKGVFSSSNEGLAWKQRCINSIAKSLTSLQDGGGELIGMTHDGHVYASRDKGATWARRR